MPFLEQLTALATLHYSSRTADFNERSHVFSSSATSIPDPYRSPGCTWYTMQAKICYSLAVCSSICSPDTSVSVGVSSSLLGKGNSGRDVFPAGLSLLWRLIQRSTIFWCLDKYLPLRPASPRETFLCDAATDNSHPFSINKSTKNTWTWDREECCGSHMYMDQAASQR